MTADQPTEAVTRIPASVLGVFAHPDDETYLTATLMLRTLRAGGTATLVTATRGEVGAPHPELSSEEIAVIRERELREAMARLGVDDVNFLDRIDGECAESDPPIARLVDLLASRRPELIVTFGPDGISRHSDHVAVSRWTSAAWLRAREQGLLSGNSRLLYATVSETFAARHFADYPDFPLTLQGEPAITADADIVLDIEPTAEEFAIKKAVLSAHETQTRGPVELLGEDRYYDWWRSETFREPTAAELDAARGVRSHLGV
ncbi:LmbE family N-acetylglucosaminyl deacetylase [Brevibacterium sanguinis]|uniref:LmbE family N-acetylglucosaminyl deacetylase n=2 Tax=Brevibacterium TaxID=1696 RepID=A0A366IDV1_9MICO|nr:MULTISPECIES: PIG-L family deacetylase [Brevibacterium]RBP62558.1 LmbE family N-acetylglucosaminyl deacetylase [Brevibacterium sanguinis]RBP69222.1 LmbE family N-acetylglucosaminyl deacetylase [Brevibacterium celere]